jgi:hypothetical protein
LELTIWTEYCTQSTSNADWWKKDAVRDVNGFVSAFKQLVALVAPDPRLEIPSDVTERLRNLCSLVGIAEVDRRYQRVSDVAQELSPETGVSYRNFYTILSKFVHPTASSIKSSRSPEDAAMLTDGFLKVGTTLVLAVASLIAKASLSLKTSSQS